MDRVLLAVDRTHYNLTPAQKRADGYQEVFTSAAIMHFGAGVRPDIGKVILAQAAPPATIEGMLSSAEAVEAEQAKKIVPGASALAVTEAPDCDQTTATSNSFDFNQLQSQISELTEVVAAINHLIFQKLSATGVISLDISKTSVLPTSAITQVPTSDSHDKQDVRDETPSVAHQEPNTLLKPIKRVPGSGRRA